MDDVAIGVDEPQEEEMALGSLGTICSYFAFYFPREAEKHFRRSVLMQDLTASEREKFAADYRYILQKMSLIHGGEKQILFKNPASTARMEFLSTLFPGAKFVHIVRNPVDVYQSSLKLWDRMLEAFSLQQTQGFPIDQWTLDFYRLMMKKHLAQRENIPDANYFEIRYEELAANPFQTIEKIHQKFGWEFDELSASAVRSYLDSLASYQANRRNPDPNLIEMLRKEWNFAFEHWQY